MPDHISVDRRGDGRLEAAVVRVSGLNEMKLTAHAYHCVYSSVQNGGGPVTIETGLPYSISTGWSPLFRSCDALSCQRLTTSVSILIVLLTILKMFLGLDFRFVFVVS